MRGRNHHGVDVGRLDCGLQLVAGRAPKAKPIWRARSLVGSTARTVTWPSLEIAAARFCPIRPHPTIAKRMSRRIELWSRP
jgi:hypothetical protein